MSGVLQQEYVLGFSSARPISTDIFRTSEAPFEWASGKQPLVAGQRAHFYIHNVVPNRTDVDVCLLLHAFKRLCEPGYHAEAQWLVWLYGPSMFTASVLPDIDSAGHTQGYFVDFVAPDPGSYQMYVVWMNIDTKPWWSPVVAQQVLGSPFALEVRERPAHTGPAPPAWQPLPPATEVLDISRAGNLPFCTHAREQYGRWVRCADAPEALGCMRGGWIWLPLTCRLQFYHYDLLPRVRHPTWIVIAGSSIIRGTFLMLMDRMLGTRVPSIDERTTKCWGWIDFYMGNMRISYLDFRVHNMVGECAILFVCYTITLTLNQNHSL
jgi:hypothetical protein